MTEKKYKDVTWLKRQYYEEQKSTHEMAKIVGVCSKTITNYMDKFGLKRRPATNINYVKLSEEAYEFLTGELLGDASVIWGEKPTSAYYSLTSKHEAYLKWIESKLLTFGILKRGHILSYKNKYGTYWLLQTKYYRTQMPGLRWLWYPNGKKIVPHNITLTPLTTKIWFIEDGCAINSHYIKRIELATNGFYEEDVFFLVDQLQKALGTNKIYRTQSNTITLSKQSVIKRFYNYIGECPKEIINVFGYKWKLVNSLGRAS